MRGKTAKLLRKLAATNPYNVDNFTVETRYAKQPLGNYIMNPGFRLSYKYLKKFYKLGHYNTATIREELAAK